jgi:hypothetical protein
MFETKSGIFETKPDRYDRYDAPRAPLERLAESDSPTGDLPWAMAPASKMAS